MIEKLQVRCLIKELNSVFYISPIPYLDNNIPSKIFYISIGSEILQITRRTVDLINMVVTHVNLYWYG